MSYGSRTYLTMAVGGLVLGTLLLLGTILFREIGAREGVLETATEKNFAAAVSVLKERSATTRGREQKK